MKMMSQISIKSAVTFIHVGHLSSKRKFDLFRLVTFKIILININIIVIAKQQATLSIELTLIIKPCLTVFCTCTFIVPMRSLPSTFYVLVLLLKIRRRWNYLSMKSSGKKLLSLYSICNWLDYIICQWNIR